MPGGIARPFRGTAQRKQSGVNDGRQDASAIGAQPLTARTPWHDEGNSKTASLAPPRTPVFGKCAARAGPRGPESRGRAQQKKGAEAPKGQSRPRSANDVVRLPATMT